VAGDAAHDLGRSRALQEDLLPADYQGKYYLAGDGATYDEDGYIRIMGRIDDVLNVAGHRLGTMEIESRSVANPKVAEAAVVGRPDDLTGEAIVAFVVLKQARPEGGDAQKIIKELQDWVGKEIGAIAKPKDIRSATTCRRRARARSCGGLLALDRQGARRSHRTCPRSRTPPFSDQLIAAGWPEAQMIRPSLKGQRLVALILLGCLLLNYPIFSLSRAPRGVFGVPLLVHLRLLRLALLIALMAIVLERRSD
jgi:hypothetical protein